MANILATLLLALSFLALIALADAHEPTKLTFYLQQQFGENELVMVQGVRPPAPGTVTGFGQQVVYEFVMTETQNASSKVLGFVRGTAVVVNNTANATVFAVNNVIHYDNGKIKGTISQQGEAIFTQSPWKFAVVGGTGAFRNVHGYNVGSFVKLYAVGNQTHIVNHYVAHLFDYCES